MFTKDFATGTNNLSLIRFVSPAMESMRMFNKTAPLNHPLTSGPCPLVSGINKTTLGGINKTSQLRLDQLLAR